MDIFFVISGFLITRLLCEEHEKTGRVDIGSFWLRRAFRLMPAVWLVLAVVLVLAALGLITDSFDDTVGASWQTLLYIRNWFMAFGHSSSEATAHMWSLAVEEQFYVLWPLVFIAVIGRYGRRGVARVALAGAAVAAVEAAVLAERMKWERLGFGLDARGSIALLGGAALGASAITRVPRVVAWASGLFLLVVPAVQVSRKEVWGRGAWVLLTAATCAVILEATRHGSLFERVLSWRPLVYIGTISYSIYLWHQPMLAMLHETIPGHRAMTYAAMATALTAVVAPASYYLVERPCRERGRRWLAARRTDRATAPAGAPAAIPPVPPFTPA